MEVSFYRHQNQVCGSTHIWLGGLPANVEGLHQLHCLVRDLLDTNREVCWRTTLELSPQISLVQLRLLPLPRQRCFRKRRLRGQSPRQYVLSHPSRSQIILTIRSSLPRHSAPTTNVHSRYSSSRSSLVESRRSTCFCTFQYETSM